MIAAATAWPDVVLLLGAGALYVAYLWVTRKDASDG